MDWYSKENGYISFRRAYSPNLSCIAEAEVTIQIFGWCRHGCWSDLHDSKIGPNELQQVLLRRRKNMGKLPELKMGL